MRAGALALAGSLSVAAACARVPAESTTAAGAGGESGGPPEGACFDPDDCPAAVSSSCTRPACLSGQCAVEHEPAGSACEQDGGNVCDGLGSCVRRVGLAEPCLHDADCLSGSCAEREGVCCDQPCDGACESCLEARQAPGGDDGRCALVLTSTDPHESCSSPETCGDGVCRGGNHEQSVAFACAGATCPYNGARRVRHAPGGDLILAGFYGAPIDLGGGSLPAASGMQTFVARLAPDGEHRWSRAMGGGAGMVPLDAHVDTIGNVYVVGSYYAAADLGVVTLAHAGDADGFVAKLDPDGGLLWARGFGGPGVDEVRGVSVDSQGNVVLIGSFQHTVDFGGEEVTSEGGSEDIFVAKLTAGGAHLWSRGYGSEDDGQAGWDITVDSQDNLLVTGTFHKSVTFGGATLLAIDSPNDRNIFIVKLSATGEHVWSDSVTGPSAEAGRAIAVDHDDHVLVAGDGPREGGSAVYLVEYTPDGAQVWRQDHLGSGLNSVEDMQLDAQGGMAVTGYFWAGSMHLGGALLSASTHSVFVARYDGQGAHRWSRGYGAEGLDARAWGVAIDADDHVRITGQFTGQIEFDGPVLEVTGASTGIFIAEFLP